MLPIGFVIEANGFDQQGANGTTIVWNGSIRTGDEAKASFFPLKDLPQYGQRSDLGSIDRSPHGISRDDIEFALMFALADFQHSGATFHFEQGEYGRDGHLRDISFDGVNGGADAFGDLGGGDRGQSS